MYASVSTWRLDASIQEASAYASFVRGVLLLTLPTARDLGILDALVIRTAVDTIVAVTVYDTEVAAAEAWRRVTGPMSDLYGDLISLVARVAGPASDMPQLTGQAS